MTTGVLRPVTGGAADACEIVAREDGRRLAVGIAGNPLDDGFDWPDAVDAEPATTAVVLWSGTLAPSLFASHPATWMAPGRAALERCWAALAPRLRSAGRQAWLRPHARHVLSDPPSCLAFLADHAADPLALALCPASLLEPSMLPLVEDHLERILLHLGPRCGVLILQDVVVEGDACRPVPLGRGVLAPDVVAGLVAEHVPPAVPLVVAGDDADGQLARIGR